MKLRNIIVLFGMCIFCSCTTPMFTLRSPDGKAVLGPYTFATGQQIFTSSGLLVLHKETSPNQQVNERLKNEVISELCFRDSDVREVVWFLNMEKADWYNGDGAWINPMVKIILVIPDGKAKSIPKVTLEARSITVYAALKTVAKLTGLHFSIHDGQAWLEYVE